MLTKTEYVLPITLLCYKLTSHDNIRWAPQGLNNTKTLAWATHSSALVDSASYPLWNDFRLSSNTRSSAIAGRPCDTKACQGLLKWTWKWHPRLNDLQMYFKVIKSGTNRKLVYDFLLVVYSNFCRITHHFWEIWCETVQWPWNMPKVIDSRITSKLSCDHVCKMFGRQWPNEPKIAIFNYPTLIWRPLSSEPPRISA